MWFIVCMDHRYMGGAAIWGAHKLLNNGRCSVCMWTCKCSHGYCLQLDVVGDSDCHLGAWQLQLDTSYRADMYHLRYNLSSLIKWNSLYCMQFSTVLSCMQLLSLHSPLLLWVLRVWMAQPLLLEWPGHNSTAWVCDICEGGVQNCEPIWASSSNQHNYQYITDWVHSDWSTVCY